MYPTRTLALVGMSFGALLMAPADSLLAQCNRGRGGGPTTGSTRGLTMPVTTSAGYANGPTLAMQQQMYRTQQNLLAMRRQIAQQQTQQQYLDRQELLAARRLRAEQSRAWRAQRLALAQARRQQRASSGGQSPNDPISSSPATRLVSVDSIDPFSP